MGRLPGWDYRRPYFYMVTLVCRPGLPPLSILDAFAPNGVQPNYPLTKAFVRAIRQFVKDSPGLEKIEPFIVMPDHLHLLIKLNDCPGRHTLPQYVKPLRHTLQKVFHDITGIEEALFEREWHDLIVKSPRQLVNFANYIYHNPRYRLLRRRHADRFHCYRAYRHWRLGTMAVDLVGNVELLNEPAMVAIRISRSVQEGSPQWAQLVERWNTARPGMTAVGTWRSKAEQAVFHKLLANGGNVIVLVAEGFPERWHPSGEEQQCCCAEGRLLYLSPYFPSTAKLPPGETRARCLTLNDLAKQMAAAIYSPAPDGGE